MNLDRRSINAKDRLKYLYQCLTFSSDESPQEKVNPALLHEETIERRPVYILQHSVIKCYQTNMRIDRNGNPNPSGQFKISAFLFSHLREHRIPLANPPFCKDAAVDCKISPNIWEEIMPSTWLHLGDLRKKMPYTFTAEEQTVLESKMTNLATHLNQRLQIFIKFSVKQNLDLFASEKDLLSATFLFDNGRGRLSKGSKNLANVYFFSIYETALKKHFVHWKRVGPTGKKGKALEIAGVILDQTAAKLTERLGTKMSFSEFKPSWMALGYPL